MGKRWVWLVAGGVAMTAVVGLASSGAGASDTASQSSNQIIKSGVTATKGAKSFTLSGHVTSNGQPVSINMTYNPNGSTTGTLVINGQTVHLLKVGSTVYMSADKSFWTKNANAAAAQLFAGKWVYGSINQSTFSDFQSFLDRQSLVSSFFSNVSPNGSYKKLRVSTINGQKVVGISDRTDNGTLYVAASGRPYIVRLQGGDSSGSADLTFTHYGRTVKVKAPSGAINLDQLGGTTTTAPGSSAA